MTKGDTYYLKDPNGRVVNYFDHCYIAGIDHVMEGTCYQGDGDFLADVYCKANGCTHWWFKGEDYINGSDDTSDSYYHICGSDCFLDHVRAMCFIWKLAEDILVANKIRKNGNPCYIEENYSGNEKMKSLVESMLSGYTIEKAQKEESDEQT